MTRPNNSQGCIYRGYKMSNICCDIELDCSTHDPESFSVSIGCDEDGTFYADTYAAGRVKLSVYGGGDAGIYLDLDLEDILVFALKYCRSVVDAAQDRVMKP